MPQGITIACDRGGTFTDVWAYIPRHIFKHPPPSLLSNVVVVDGSSDLDGVQVQLKLLSEDPQSYADAPTEGIRRVLQIAEGREIPKDTKIDTKLIDSIRMGTTVATNALLERKGESFALVLTKGFRDLLEMGDQTRPDLFDLSISGKPTLLYDRAHVIEAQERVTMEGWTLNPQGQTVEGLLTAAKESDEEGEIAIGVSAVRTDENGLHEDLQKLYNQGLRGVAVCLLHAWTYPAHEQAVAQIAREIGFTQISLSSALAPSIKAVPRGNAASLDAYLNPVLRRYVDGFIKSFVGGSFAIKDGASREEKTRCDFMQSDGGLVSAHKFSGLRAVLSGPAGGVVGFAKTSYEKRTGTPVIGFDMGGTSTDVSRFAGTFEHEFNVVTAGIRVACPQLGIETVAAGGGSRLTFKNSTFCVGPESVGAHPGPVCYRKGGELAITDANLVLGRLVPSTFPSIFGPNADEPLDTKASRTKFEALTATINTERGGVLPYTVDEVAAGFLRVANENMSRPMRSLTEQRGYAVSNHNLCCFGGAGGQHACVIAKGLGIGLVVVPRFSSVLSAFGIACADLTGEALAPISVNLSMMSAQEGTSPEWAVLDARVWALTENVRRQLADQDVADGDMSFEVTIGCLYDGSDTVLQIPYGLSTSGTCALLDAFVATHLRETSFSMPRSVLASSVHVRGTGKSFDFTPKGFSEELAVAMSAMPEVAPPAASQFSDAYFEFSDGTGRRVPTPVYALGDVPRGSRIVGPAIIADRTQTIVVEPRCEAWVLEQHVIIRIDVVSDVSEGAAGIEAVKPTKETEIVANPIMLAVFGNRFMSIAEQMGHTLQRTSISVSIKERLDFSCSIHGTDGSLVANAPHIPIHLGSMQYAVQAQHKHWLGKLRPGDVLLTNDGQWGGTHLPDLTTITPVFSPTDPKDPDKPPEIIFYVASRGHHTDIGGTSVTSMNPISKELWQEGVVVKSFLLCSQGRFDEEGFRKLFSEPAKYPGSSATRRIDHNITDIQAAISANVRGIHLMHALFEEFGGPTVKFYMGQIQTLAAETVRSFFRDTYARVDGRPLHAHDFMDDGTRIELEVRIDLASGNAAFDWTGTGPQTHGNFNSPISLSYAAIIYCLRCMIRADVPMPLNQGVLDPVENIVPKGSFLNPGGVVAISGSTIASQRLVDVILKAFGAAAASQGCANSFGFGTGGKDVYGNVTPGFAYGEAIGGGSGAGPGWHGSHAISVHSTNTRLTDVEVIEARCPLLVKEFAIQKGSGGRGKWRGGDGCIRHIMARIPVNCSIVSQRRVFAPYGMEGGEDGDRGRNIWHRRDPETGEVEQISLGNNGMVRLGRGDSVRIETPGGGGWGRIDDQS
ncbi:hypothetical protein FISHEDRAFT_72121 [Fistulina hepatica ATCC 64428]|uniref:5-oxoprolinase n=1 Tax=Fistulina hepatica ATCC 64428 TaxID=1128425 RepID=A0A0D7AIC3_9AGAR|nr:hypothetical protein FISHEDRAFT_72121 [Fistulina hepatica ATCC 64428]